MRREFEKFHKSRMMRAGKYGAAILEKWKCSPDVLVDVSDIHKVKDTYGIRYQDILFILDLLGCCVDYEALEILVDEEEKNKPKMLLAGAPK